MVGLPLTETGAGCNSVRQLVLGLVILVAASLQVLVFPRLVPLGLVPDVVLGLILVASALEGVASGLRWALLGGLLLDLLAAAPWGRHIVALVPAVFAGSVTRRSMYRSALLPLMGIVGFATLAYRLILTMLRWPSTADGWLDALVTAALVGMLNVLAVPLVYAIIALFGRPGVRRAH